MAVNEPARPQPLTVYPNPATDVLYLNDLLGETVDYTIFNALGQKVKAGSSDGSIRVAELDKGIYILRVDGDKHFETAKFVVK